MFSGKKSEWEIKKEAQEEMERQQKLTEIESRLRKLEDRFKFPTLDMPEAMKDWVRKIVEENKKLTALAHELGYHYTSDGFWEKKARG